MSNKFHINNDSEVRPCTATKQDCEFDAGDHFENKQDALKKAENDLSSKYGNLKKLTKLNKLSKEQKAFFSKSKAVDANGDLIKMYHGSTDEFDEFLNEHTGKGNDVFGSGFYFSNVEETVSAYGDNVREFYLNIEKPLVVEANDEHNMNDVYLPKDKIADILKNHPLIYKQPNDEDDMSPLGDFAESFWDKDTHSKAEINKMIDELSKNEFGEGSFMNVENFFGREYATEFREGVHKSTGHDGVAYSFPNGEQFYISWFPNQIKTTDNLAPSSDSANVAS